MEEVPTSLKEMLICKPLVFNNNHKFNINYRMGYGKNGSTATGDVNKPGMVMTSSQFSSPTALQTTST